MDKEEEEEYYTAMINDNNDQLFIDNNNILYEPTFNIKYYIENRNEYPNYIIGALLEIQKSKKIEKTQDILLMSKMELQRITNLDQVLLDELLFIVSQNLMYHTHKPNHFFNQDDNNDNSTNNNNNNNNNSINDQNNNQDNNNNISSLNNSLIIESENENNSDTDSNEDYNFKEFNSEINNNYSGFSSSIFRPISFITSLELEKLPVSSIKLSTGCSLLDEQLGGGISPIGITEIAGESGSGKSQLCIQLALQVQLPFESGGLSGGCLYVNTESQFPSKRLNQMYSIKKQQILQQYQQQQQPTEDLNYNIENIFVENTPNIDTLMDLLNGRIASYLEKKTIRLLIIDSVAALLRHEFSNEKSEIMERTKLLWSLSNRLKLINEQYGITVVVVNQVTDFFIDSNFVNNDSSNNNNNNNNNNNSNVNNSCNNSSNSGEIYSKDLVVSNRPFKRRKEDSKVPSFQSSKQQHVPFLLSQQQSILALPAPSNNNQQSNISSSTSTSATTTTTTTTIPALGLSWSNFINTRFLLQRSKSTVPDPFNNNHPTILRKLKVILSSSLKNQTIPFIIDASGVKCYKLN